MTKQAYYRASAAASGLAVTFTLAWAATGAPWAVWGTAGAIGAALGLMVGGYIEPTEG